MSSIPNSYAKYGNRAAMLALVPGLGHFRNRQYSIGVLTVTTISVLILWVFWLAILEFGSGHSNLSTARACFIFWTLVVWLASAVHAYLSTIRLRQEYGARHPVDLRVEITAPASSQSCASARIRNLSRTGACLLAASVFPINTQITIALDGQPTNKARVIWSKPAGNGTGNLVGVEFVRPLVSLSMQRAA